MRELERRLGESISKRRKAMGLQQADLARKASAIQKREGRKPVLLNQISRWEKGSNLISLDKLLAIAEVLEVRIDQLVTGEQSFHDQVVEELDARFAARIARIEKRLGL